MRTAKGTLMLEDLLLKAPFDPVPGDPATLAFYIAALTGALVVVGLLLSVLRFGFGKKLAGVWKTYGGWWRILPLVLGALVLGRVAVIVGALIVALMAFKEYARATGLYRDWPVVIAVYLAMLALGVVTLVPDPRLANNGWYGMYMALPVFAIAGLFLLPIARDRARGQLQSTALAVLGFVYIGWMFLHLGFLTNLPRSLPYLLYLIVAVQLNDIAAFTFGKLFGKRRLRKNISPNKTWTGAAGALAVSMVMPWAFHFTFPWFGTTELILTGLIVGLGGQLGDLTMSWVKRDLDIKDMGSLIPGHGGMLDRIDSLIYTAPLFFHMVRWYHGV